MANLITLTRLMLLYVLVILAYHQNPVYQLANFPLLSMIFLLDAVDGYVARRRNEESLFGSLFDIAIDRIVENVLWLVLVDLDFVHAWVAIVFITRSFLVDSVRAYGASQKLTPFGMMRSSVGKFIVSGRLVRIFYSFIKVFVFGYIFLIQPWPALFPAFYTKWKITINIIKQILVYTAVAACLIRGLPVLLEFAMRDSDHISPPQQRE